MFVVTEGHACWLWISSGLSIDSCIKEKNTPQVFCCASFFRCINVSQRQALDLQVKWWKKVERKNSAHPYFKKEQCEWQSQPNVCLVFLPCLWPHSHLDVLYAFSAFRAPLTHLVNHMSERFRRHWELCSLKKEWMSYPSLQQVKSSPCESSQELESFFPMNCTDPFGDQQQQAAKLHSNEAVLQHCTLQRATYSYHNNSRKRNCQPPP